MKYKNIIYIIIIAVLIYYAFSHNIVKYINDCYNPKEIKNWVQSFGKLSLFAFIFLQILQVVVFFIPGEAIQAVGGYIYGTVYGTILSIVGIAMGSLLTFFIARHFGQKLLEKIIPAREYLKIKKIIDKSGNKYILFVLYLIPGFPKDILGYVSGITKISTKNFILYSTIARIPGIVMSSFIGSNLYSKDYTTVIIAIIVMLILFIIGTLKGQNIINFFNKNYKAKYNH